MADIASLVVKVSTDGVNKAENDLNKLANQSNKTEKSTNDLATSFGGLKTVLATIGISEVAKQYVQMADSMKLLEARIKLVSSASDNYKAIQSDMTRIANENGIAIKNVGELYTKLSTALKPLGVTTSSVMAVTDAFSKTLLISGASIEEASSATLQFAQAMASGRLQGDEFRSMAENSPRFMKAMTDALGKTSSELRKMAEDGKLTSSVVGGALIDSLSKLQEEARNMPLTVGKAFNELKNETTLTVEQFDKMSGLSATIANGFQGITDKVVGLRQELPKLSEEMTKWEKEHEKGLYTLGVVADTIWSGVSSGVRNFYAIERSYVSKNISNALTLTGKIGEAFGIADDQSIKFSESQKKVQAELAKTAKAHKDMAQSIDDEVDAYVAKQQFKNIAIPEAEVKKQLDKSLGGFKAYYKAIGDEEAVLAIKRYELREQYKDLTDNQIDSIINAERDKNDKLEQLEKEWQKRKFELTYENEIARSDEMAKPFIELEKKYKEDLEHFKGNEEAKKLLTENYYIEAERLQKDAIAKVNKLEEEKNKKSAEWQVKLFEANEKINDQIIAQREKMYGASSEAQIEAWYNNQLEWLGKLALEGKATSEELQGLLNKIDSLKELKLKEQTISFKIEKSFYDSFENSLTDSIEDAFNGDSLNLKKFFKNIQRSLTNTIASSISGSIVNSLRGGSSLLGGLSSLAVGSSVSASEISTIMNSGGTFDSATNTITTSGGSKIGVGSDGSGTVKSTGSDVMSLVNTISTLKTVYQVATTGLSATIASGVSSISSGLSSLGMAGAANTFSSFGYGVASPSMAGLTGTYGAAASIGSAVGYVMPYVAAYFAARWGSKQFEKMMGISTYDLDWGGYIKDWSQHSTWENVNFVLTGGLNMPFVGKKKTTDTGLQFLQDVTSSSELDSSKVVGYADWKKKTLFSSKGGTDYRNLDQKQLKQIEAVFDYYDDLLRQLGDTDKIVLSAGKYSGDSFQAQITKNFIKAFTDIDQNTDATIYNAWVDYATEIDKTITEALTTSIGTFISTKRTFDIWQVGADSIEGLAKKAQYAQEDFNNLANSLDATGVTVDNYLTKYNEAIKESFTPETITSWKNLGDALMSATDAQKSYTDAVKAQEDALKALFNNVDSIVLGVNDSLNGIDYQKKFNEASNTFTNLTHLSVTDLESFNRVSESIKNSTLTEEQVTAFGNLGTALVNLTKSEQEALATTQALQEALLSRQVSIGSTLVSFTDSLDGIDYQNKFNEASAAFNVLTGFIVTNRQELEKAGEALKTSSTLTDAQVTAFSNLSSALLDLTKNAQDVENALVEANKAINKTIADAISNNINLWEDAQNAIKQTGNAIADTVTSFKELRRSDFKVKNYNDLLSSLQSTVDYEKSLANSTYDTRIEQLTKEKELFLSLQDYIDSLNTEMVGTQTTYINELNKAKEALTKGQEVDISKLTAAASSYLDNALQNSTSQLEYFREVAKVKDSIGSLGSIVGGGTLESVEAAIASEEATLAFKLDRINATAQDILAIWSGKAKSSKINSIMTFAQVKTDAVASAYQAAKGTTPTTENYSYWLDRSMAEGLRGEALINAIKIDGSHAGGLERVPFDGYIAELHKGERVQTASEVKNDSMITDLTNSIKDLKDMFIKNIAETSRMSRVITRLDDNDALLVRVVV